MTNNQIYTFIFLFVKLGCKMNGDQTKFAFQEVLKQGLKSKEILIVICHFKVGEQNLLR